MRNNHIKELEKLDYNKQLTFAYLLCERLYPNYLYFSRKFFFGNEQILRTAIDFIYDSLLIPNRQVNNDINFLLSEIDINTPFPHNFETILASSALDACSATSETLYLIIERNPTRLNNISTYATDTIDMYFADKENLDFNNDPQFEEKIFNSPLMQRELKIQAGIVTYLSKIDTVELLDIKYLLDIQYNEGKSNIDLN